MKATADVSKINEYFGAIHVMHDECLVHVAEAGWNTKIVDPAHVAMLSISLPKEAFTEYECEKEDLCLDIEKVMDHLKLCKGAVEITTQEDKNTVTFKSGGLTRVMFMLSTDKITDPKIPNLGATNSVTITIDDAKGGARSSSLITDHVQLTINAEGFTLSSKGEIDGSDLFIPKDKCIEHVLDGGDVKSIYSLDYFTQLLSVMDKQVKITFNTDFPAMFHFSTKHIPDAGFYLLAPRIEND